MLLYYLMKLLIDYINKIGFNEIGIVKKGYINKNNEYEDIVLYYIDLSL